MSHRVSALSADSGHVRICGGPQWSSARRASAVWNRYSIS